MTYNNPRSARASLSFQSYVESLGGAIITITNSTFTAGKEIKSNKITTNNLILLNGLVLIPHKDYKLTKSSLFMNFDLYSDDEVAILPFNVEDSNEDLFKKDPS